MDDVDERVAALRAQFVGDARLDRSAFLGDRPHVRQLAGAIDRRDRSFDAAFGEGSLVAAAELGLDPRVVRPPPDELFRVQERFEHPGNRGTDRDLRVREEDAAWWGRFGGTLSRGRTGHGAVANDLRPITLAARFSQSGFLHRAQTRRQSCLHPRHVPWRKRSRTGAWWQSLTAVTMCPQ